MALPDATVRHYDAVQRIAAVALAGLSGAWARMGEDFDATYAAIAPGLVELTRVAKVRAAESGAQSVAPALRAQGLRIPAQGQVDPTAWGRATADGRSISGLLDIGVVRAKQAVGDGLEIAEALRVAQDRMASAIQTEIADAGRSAARAQMVATPRTGWTRVVNPPCCGRCAVLAGRFYRWSDGFLRHPRCDCTMVPSVEGAAAAVTTTPQSLYEAMDDAQRRKAFSKAGARAIADGADIVQVVNARRGMSFVGAPVTLEGTTRRGVAGRALGSTRGRAATRLTPEGIYAQAGEDRELAVDLLGRNGYLR